MTSIEAKRLAQRIARIEREQANQGKPQLAYSSIENGNLKSYEGNDLKMVVGLQDDGGQATTVFNGPTPPTPANYTVTVDHGSLTVHWDGDFENDVVAPSDWARWTAYAQEGATVTPSRVTAIGGTDSASGGEVTAGVLKGQWTVTVLAWSQAGKPSVMGDPVTVDVPGYGDIVLAEIDAAETDIKNAGEILVTEQDTLNDKLDDAFGQIEDAIVSANGKNVVHYQNRRPTSADAGVEGDTWFVGQVGRPNDEILSTNLITNPSFENDTAGWNPGNRVTLSVVSLDGTVSAGTHSAEFKFPTGGANATTSMRVYRDVYKTVSPGQWVAMAAFVRRGSNAQSGLESQLYAEFATSSGSYISRPMSGAKKLTTDRMDASPTSPNRQTFVVQVPAGAGLLSSPGIRFQADGDMAKVASSDYGYMDAWQIRVAGSQTEAAAAIEAYFDGDTPNGSTDNDPHYRWTGTPHASTSEKYLPATEGLSSNWNVTAQYRHDGTGWVEVELSHHVISSADVGTLVAGSATIKEAVVQKLFAEVVVAKMVVAEEFIGENAILTGAVTAPKITASEELWAKIGEFVKIRAEQLEADAIDGMVITGPTIQSARTGQRWVGDTTGIRIFNADNEVRTQLSPDGSVFKGEVEADTLVVNGGSEMRSTENKLAQGAKLTLEAGVADPTAPPTVQPYWDATEFTPGTINGEPMKPVGLAWDGTSYWTANSRVGFSGASNRIFGFRIDAPGSGTLVNIMIPHGTPWHSEVFGVTCIGSELFWLGRSFYEGMVWVTDLAGAFKRAFAYPDLGYSSSNPLGYKPGIGNDGTNVVTAQCTDAGRATWRVWNKTTGAQISYTEESNDNAKTDFTGVHIGASDWGGGTFVTLAKARSDELVTFTTAGVYDGTKMFRAAAGGSVGVVFAGGKFRTLDPTGKIHEYADTNTGDASGDWWATYRWSADVDEDGINDSVSRIGPVKRFTWPRRGKLKFLGAPLPVGAGYITPSIAKKATTPVRTDFRTPGFSVNVGESVAFLSVLPTDWLSGANPGDANTFPEAESSVLTTASNTFRLQGDGSGYWGPLKMGRNGVMSGLIVTGFVLLAVDEDNTTKKFTINLPAGRFTRPPSVWVNISTAAPQNVWTGVVSETISTATFEVNFRRTTTAATGVTWFAMDSE